MSSLGTSPWGFLGWEFAPKPVALFSCKALAMNSAKPLLCFNCVPKPGSHRGEGGSTTMILRRARWRSPAQPPSPCLLAEMSPEQGLVSGGAQLQLSPLQPFHQGQYTCLTRGLGAETRKDFMVLVRGRASPLQPGPWGLCLRGEPSSPSCSSASLSPRCSGPPDQQLRGPQ